MFSERCKFFFVFLKTFFKRFNYVFLKTFFKRFNDVFFNKKQKKCFRNDLRGFV